MEDSKESRLRAEFEAWFSDGGEYPLACQRAKDGGYMLAQAESSWTAWQAAWRAGRNDLANEMGEAVEEDNRAASASRSEMERDAARYRFLRDDPPVTLSVRRFPGETERGCYLDGPTLDAAIDALLAKYQGE